MEIKLAYWNVTYVGFKNSLKEKKKENFSEIEKF